MSGERLDCRLAPPGAVSCDSAMLSRALSAGFIEPCLPSSAEKLPSGPDWVHEIKHDGYRLMARAIRSASGCSPATGTTGRRDIR